MYSLLLPYQNHGVLQSVATFEHCWLWSAKDLDPSSGGLVVSCTISINLCWSFSYLTTGSFLLFHANNNGQLAHNYLPWFKCCYGLPDQHDGLELESLVYVMGTDHLDNLVRLAHPNDSEAKGYSRSKEFFIPGYLFQIKTPIVMPCVWSPADIQLCFLLIDGLAIFALSSPTSQRNFTKHYYWSQSRNCSGSKVPNLG